MRRFELVDGTSKKFWEIALEGTSFTVRFGRIGTSGQVQQKTFGSADKASAEHDKLVAEKLKKGYAEIGSSGAAAPAPTPAKAPVPAPAPAKATAKASTKPAAGDAAPPPAPVPAEDGAPIAWDDAFLRRVHARRGGVQVPIRALPTVSKAWSGVRKLFDEIAQPVRAGKTRAHALKELTTAVLNRMKSDDPSPAPVEEDAALLTFLEHRASYDHHPNAEPALDLIYLLSGPVHATRAVLESMAMNVPGFGVREEPAAPMPLVRGPEEGRYNGFTSGDQRSPSRLRELLATVATDAEYASALEAAADVHKPNRHQLFARAFLFPTDRALLDQVLKKKPSEDDEARLLLACATATSTLQALAPHLSMYWFGRTSWDSLPSLLDGAGRDAVAFFDELKVQIADAPADGRRAWADSLAHINSDEAMALLVDAAEHKEVVPLVAQAIARWPRRAMRLLAARAAAKGAGGEAARALLASLVRKDPASVDAVLPGLSAEAVRALESLRQGAAAIAADAPPERLPAILRNPPWIGATPRPLPVLEVKVIAPKDQMAWRPGEQEEWRAHRGYTYVRDVSSTEVQRILKNGGGHTALFRFLPDGPALKAIHAHPFGRWGEMEWLPTLVARFELQILPDVVRAADEHGPGALGVLEPYASAEIAPRMAEMAARSKIGRPHAVAWLLRHPTHAAAGLLAGALGPAGKEKDRACQALRLLAANGHRELVLDAARNTRPPCRDAAQEILDADPLLQFPARLPKLPAWYDAAALPPLLLADRSGKVPAAGVDVLVTMLAFPNADGWYPGIEEVKRALDPASARELAWGLFNLWMTGGASSKESWALQALGALGDDEIARRLVPLIRQWPGEAAHARAVMGLDVLAAIGTDVTLTYLNGIAEKVKFKGLQQRAQEKISEIAEARGLTRDELADRLVPTLGLDDDGSLQLDFGPRTFTVGFDEHLRPYVKDAEGARIKDLPKPGKSDDAEKAAAAEERWKALKKDARASSEIQVLRMELAMCLRRRWPAAAFKQLFVDHPLLVHVVRRLVWGTYDARGALQATFRVAEDRTFADQADETFTLPEDAVVGIPHALELPAAVAGAWGQVLGDYQLVQPFPQLGRPTFAITAEERKARELDRARGLKVPTGKVLGLEKTGWRRGTPQDAGVVCWMEKRIAEDRVLTLDLEPGLYTGMLSESPEQTLGAVTLMREGGWSTEDAFPLGELDPIVFSELVRDLEGLRG